MISMLLVATVAGLATGRVLGWLRDGRRADRKAPLRQPVAPATAPHPGLTALPCTLGDVVLLADGEEAWLAGALLLREGGPDPDERGESVRTVLAVFFAPGRGGDRAVVARVTPDASVDWMWPVSPTLLSLGGEPPSVVELEGRRFERVRRLPLLVEVLGAGVPAVGANAIVGEYDGGAGATLLVVIGDGATLAWRGRRLEPGMYDVLPGITPDA